LISKKQDGFEGEFSTAEIEEVLERGTKQVDDHGIIVAFGAKPTDKRDSDTASKSFVDSRFVFQLRMLGFG